MPKLPTHMLRWSEEKQVYELLRDGRPLYAFAEEGDLTWREFLATSNAFAFEGREGRISLSKEGRQRGTGYWYAYRTSGRRTSKRYLGSAGRVTLARLEEAASVLRQMNPGAHALGRDKAAEEQTAPPAALLLSKLLPPRLPPALVARPRLLKRLDAALTGKLTLLVAPAGYGKTTLINQWLHEKQRQGLSQAVAWVSLDREDNDSFRFWHSLIMACQAFQPRLGQDTLAALTRTLPTPFTLPPEAAVLTPLLNDLARVARGVLLVLDDYQVIEEPRIHAMMTFFLEHLPINCTVVVLTRAEPRHWPLLRWRAGGELCELHGTDLRFSLAEMTDFMRQALAIPISPTTLAQMETSLQGWATGLRLLVLALPSFLRGEESEQAIARAIEHAPVDQPSSPDAPASPYQPLLDYFVTEIFNAQPEARQHFLLQTSVLTLLNGPLCEAITGLENSSAHLEALEQSGLFLEALDGRWYRFHALFAEAMRREALLRLGEERLRTLSLQASRWYEEHGLLTAAVETALPGRDFERVAGLIEQMNAQGQLAELAAARRWLAQLPEDVLYKHPRLCWLAALTLRARWQDAPLPPAEREQMELLLRMAESRLDQQHSSELTGLIASLRAADAWQQGAISSALAYAHQALAALPEDEQRTSLQLWRGVCLFIIGTARLTEGALAEAQSAFQEAHACSLDSGDGHFMRSLLILCGVCSYLLGAFYQAREYYQQALHDARRYADREIVVRALLGLATISFAWNRLALAENEVSEALQLVPEAHPELRIDATLQLAELAYARGEIAEAHQQIEALLAHLQMTGSPLTNPRLVDIQLFAAHLALETGDAAKAERIVEALAPAEQLALRIFQARLLIWRNAFHLAIVQLESLVAETSMWSERIEIQILLALAYAACGEGLQARHWLQQALSEGYTMALIRPFLAAKEPVARLLRQLAPSLREPALRSYAQTLLRAFIQAPLAEIAHADSAPDLLAEPLSAQEQRVLRLLAAGHSNGEIAQTLVISINTVKDHAKHLYRKLGVSNRQQAGEMARRLKLI